MSLHPIVLQIIHRTIKDVHGQGGMKVHVYDGIWTSCPNCSCEISVQGLGNNFTCPQCQCELYKEGSAQTEYHSNSCDNYYGGSGSNYRTEKNKRNTTDRLELKKHCPKCKKTTTHKEKK